MPSLYDRFIPFHWATKQQKNMCSSLWMIAINKP